MAITIKNDFGEKREKHTMRITGTLSLDSNYPTNGEDVSMIHPRISRLEVVGSQYILQFFPATKKLKAFEITSSKLAEVGNGTNLSGESDLPFVAFVDVE